MGQITAEIVADSISPQGDRLISVLATFPRIILSEMNTHRMLSKNTSSSRAIPFSKMVEAVMTNPFIPIAWQKNHLGMQGTEYLSKTDKYSIDRFMDSLHDTLLNMLDKENPEYIKLKKTFDEKLELLNNIFDSQILSRKLIDEEKTLDEWWLFARDRAVEAASIMYIFDVTKQLDNRILEPFMWTTMLITGPRSGWDNFFNLRCPQYQLGKNFFKSKKDWKKFYEESIDMVDQTDDKTPLFWLRRNKGQAEIHIMDLAEKIYDAVNESFHTQILPTMWHVPFRKKINELYPEVENDSEDIVKISVSMAARASYTVVGTEKILTKEEHISLHDRLLTQNPPHSSPMEHCCLCVSEEEYNNSFKGVEKGWFRNYKGFKSYRHIIETKKYGDI